MRRGETQHGSAALEGASSQRYQLRFRWYRGISRAAQVCWCHPDRDARIQCILCLRGRCDIRKSFHCSNECFRQHWQTHKELHEARRLNGPFENGYVADLLRSNTSNSSNAGEAWSEICTSRCFTPGADDVGASLRLEVVVIDTALHGKEVSRGVCQATGRVHPTPAPPARQMIPIPAPNTGTSKFTALTYNLLADLYTSADAFPASTPLHLHWQYRKQNLLRELLAYKADVLCLQEVQSNHIHDFLAPELDKLYTGTGVAMDGCATFFRKDRFALVKKYEVEFNKAALSLSDAIPEVQKKAALTRLLKDNVALIAVLEALDPGHPDTRTGGRRQLICVANTHIHANPELNDVKLWQVHTLLKGLEKIAASADIPMLVAGDFNSVPGSAAHQLLVKQTVDERHPELANDPLNINRPSSKLQHQLPLGSAYAAVLDSQDGGPLQQKQRRQMDVKHREPKFTNMSQSFTGTLDYVLYTTDSLVPSATLELPDQSDIRTLPNESWSSDHIALMAEFSYVRKA
eukprot:jgi/Astpho2/3815/fgenesh1_pm.00062_%23_7_t